MADVIRGGCLCGRVRYEYTGDVGPANYCHCSDCRRCTGSAYNIGVRLTAAQFTITSGSPKGYTKRGESGGELTRHFCGECGSPLFTSSPGIRTMSTRKPDVSTIRRSSGPRTRAGRLRRYLGHESTPSCRTLPRGECRMRPNIGTKSRGHR